jgi:iron complex transport system permease protein
VIPGVAPARLGGGALIGSLVVLIAALSLAAVLGPSNIEIRQVVVSALDRLPGLSLDPGLTTRQSDILWLVRLPRVVLGAVVGGTLALCGAAYQGVFRNPLADPYLLGVAAGAGLGATIAVVQGGGSTVFLPVAAFGGALVAVTLTYLLGRVAGGGSATTLILSGVAVASFLTAAQTFVQQRNDETIRQVYSWILGRLSTSGWSETLVVMPYVVIAAVVILSHRRLLDVMSVGDGEAAALGVDVARVRLVVVGAATLGTAAVVAVSGLIGFVGIIVPHAIRMVFGVGHRVVLPLALIGGAAFLVLADVVARTALAPAELPIGVVTAMFGAPFFAVILRSRQVVQ